jgi:predicted DNA-binding protein
MSTNPDNAQRLTAENAELRARLERVREALSKRAGGVDLVTSHVVREVIERGLDSIERDLSRK